jgi:hypothetical protein
MLFLRGTSVLLESRSMRGAREDRFGYVVETIIPVLDCTNHPNRSMVSTSMYAHTSECVYIEPT